MIFLQKIAGFRSGIINALIDCVRMQSPVAGPGVLLSEGPGGTVISLLPPPAPYVEPHAWTVKWSEADESYIVYIPEGAARIFLTDQPDTPLVPAAVTIGLTGADVGGDWYVFAGSIGDVWASISDGEIIVSMTADSAKGALIAEIKASSIIQIARSPLEFFIAASDPDAPEPLPTDDDDDACDQNTHPGEEDAAEDVHPGDSDGDDSDPSGGDGDESGSGSDEDNSDHPGAADCYTTT
jgi:hypothetical protein